MPSRLLPSKHRIGQVDRYWHQNPNRTQTPNFRRWRKWETSGSTFVYLLQEGRMWEEVRPAVGQVQQGRQVWLWRGSHVQEE